MNFEPRFMWHTCPGCGGRLTMPSPLTGLEDVECDRCDDGEVYEEWVEYDQPPELDAWDL